MKKLKCCGCKAYFDKDTLINLNGSNFHDISCASEHGTRQARKSKVKQLKLEKKAHNQRKREFKDNDRSFQIKKTQQVFNRFIRLRDHAEHCISCGRYHAGQYHAGHYRTVGGHPELRFSVINCHKQCSVCNNHKSGNIVEYRINLRGRIGDNLLDWLEGPHDAKKYTIEQLKEIKLKYRAKWREIERNS